MQSVVQQYIVQIENLRYVLIYTIAHLYLKHSLRTTDMDSRQ